MDKINMMPVEVSFKPSGKYWIASCPSLDIHTQGEDFESANENLKEALVLFFESCLSRGTLKEVLRQAGYSPVQINSVEEAAKQFHLPPPAFAECRA